MKVALACDIKTLKSNETYLSQKERGIELRESIRQLKITASRTPEEDKDLVTKQTELSDIHKYFADVDLRLEQSKRALNDNGRGYIVAASSKTDYNKYMSHHFNQRSDDNKVEYDCKEALTPSRDYRVDPTVEASSSRTIDYLLWGRYP
jgi:hypothetical protein